MSWNDWVGPFYDAPGLASVLRVTVDEVTRLAEAGDLLCTPTFDGVKVFPSFQVGPNRELLPHLRLILQLLDPEQRDPWGDAIWLNTATPEFGDQSAAELLRAGQTDLVRAAAASDGRIWRS